MKIGSRFIHAASILAQFLVLNGRVSDADAIFAIVDNAINKAAGK